MIFEARGFDWDEGNRAKCLKHGLTFQEIEAAFKAKFAVMPDQTGNAETRFNLIAGAREGRHIFVVFTLRTLQGNVLIRPISARYMHEREVMAYERSRST